LTSEARALTCLYATYLMGWTEEKTKQEKLAITEEASTMVACDLGRKVWVRRMVKTTQGISVRYLCE
jgi:hypothetical protein